MISARITPKIVWLGLSLNLCAWLAAHMPWWAGLTGHMWVTESVIKTGFLCFAYALALALNLEIAAEYRQTRWLRVAWLALAGNAGVSIIRIVVESSLFNLVWPDYTHSPLWGLLQHLAIVPANAFLLFGLLAMWWAYHQVGLGFSLEKRDYAAIVGILLLLVSLIVFREGLSQALSPYALSRWLQLIGLALLSLSAAASLATHRMAMQMGGGKLAIALRLLTLYTLLRGVLVLVQAGQNMSLTDGQQASGAYSVFMNLCWQAVPWVATLAAAYRAEMTVHAARELEQQRAARAMLVSV
ncbi:MAG TPA: hypothetical protein VE961_28005 [Pyrinomonadaceae bacterium]|nr:hypothetical protein [Pyrinomonadaceae bacterium]